MADIDFLFENPKLKQRLIASGVIPPPSSNTNMEPLVKNCKPKRTSKFLEDR